ncbi:MULTISPECIES: GNAT family N-acetyltransferase [unclassified Facklamia]|uniref:GNAT family N-acetyltransferase n=1 Tax=Aerococcaceae TaxID=186827 RepID=UPI0013B7FA02|nr:MULTISPECIES: GNAT family N-acetyltransferase [unclassified Facklamia]MBS4461644.1 GNAT family N-acetyltransferase [Aerococcaceae bacterium zg-B36]NEW63936.1 GNAT family N-acetyltransferase [Facklamia sp. 252]NEW67407.1 GNAT family N-acetyltransferase [Facklamia sp. 253]QQD65282.1 GNAT family N-acetyltransferase [Aerococcaceae bacterium zg-252]
MIIRPIQVSDAPAIQKINAMELGYTILLEQMEERIVTLLQESNHHYLFVAEIDNQVVGYVHAQRYDSLLAEQAWLNIMALAVDAQYQGQSIGKALMSRIEMIAQQQHYGGIRLNSGSQREEAHQFYEHIGYAGDKMQRRFIKKFD